MTLFAALTAKDGENDASTQSSSSPPEAIQLHSNRVIDFLNATTHLLNPSSSSNSNKSSGGEESTKEELSSTATTTSKGQSKYFSALSYQAIQTLQEDGPTSAASSATTATSAAAQMRHLRPDLGVWDCRINGTNTEASALLLKRVVMNKKTTQLATQESNSSGEEKKADETAVEAVDPVDSDIFHPIVMAVDLSDPTEVQPVVEHMRNVILNVYESEDKAASNPPQQVQCTTSMKALQNSPFGKTLIQEEVTTKGSGEEQRIALILAVIVPPTITTATSSAAEEYKERQARALLLYHLHKFSLEVDCTLVFVSEKSKKGTSPALLGGSEGEEEEKKTLAEENDPLLGRNTTMSIEELGRVVRRVAMGLSPVEVSEQKTNNDEKEKGENEGESKEDANTLPERPPSIHVPGSHDAELIHGAYLRNASCEGRWDATKDDLTVALVPSSHSKNALGAKEEIPGKSGGGDEEWLSQLASSIGLSPDAATTAPGEALTPVAGDKAEQRKRTSVVKARPKRSTLARNKDAKPKDEKEVMNFFDNLLKK